MIIDNIKFDSLLNERKKCIGYDKAGRNKVVKPYETLYRLDHITGHEEHNNYYLYKDSKIDSYKLYEDIGVICRPISNVYGDMEIENLSNALASYDYKGIEGFIREVREKMNIKVFIGLLEIELLHMIGQDDLSKKCYEYRENWIKERDLRLENERIKAAEKEKEEMRIQKEKDDKVISDTENKIKNNEPFIVEKIGDTSIVNILMKKHNIIVPLKTQGWVNKKLAMIIFNGNKISYKFYGKNQNDNSKVFIDYLVMLKEKIDNEIL